MNTALSELVRAGRYYGKIGVFNEDGDRAECHICGRWYILLASHVWQAHGILADDYRELFGLKYSQGLCSDGYRERCGERAKRMIADGVIPTLSGHMTAEGIAKVTGRPQRKQSILANIETHPITVCKQICEICGTEFDRTFKRDRLTCSDKCRRERRRQISKGNRYGAIYFQTATPEQLAQRAAKIRAARMIRIPKKCVICGDLFEVIPSHYDEARTCRKPECVHTLRSKTQTGKLHTAESRARMSDIRREYWRQRHLVIDNR